MDVRLIIVLDHLFEDGHVKMFRIVVEIEMFVLNDLLMFVYDNILFVLLNQYKIH
jgi:hypothetical protein